MASGIPARSTSNRMPMATLRAKFRYFGGFGMVSQIGDASRKASPKECSRCLFTAPFYVVAPAGLKPDS